MNNNHITIEQTADGSDTLYVPEIDEHYHSINGAVQEALHVYINTGLNFCSKKEINVLEIGFGTGLNTYLSFLNALKENKKINYSTIELYPLSFEIIKALNYPERIDLDTRDIFYDFHYQKWNSQKQINAYFIFNKIQTDFRTYSFEEQNNVDVIYYDAFGPDKQPEMWQQEFFDKLYKINAINGCLVTYCAKGEVRRKLQKSGYMVERLPGPPGKREMLRAVKK